MRTKKQVEQRKEKARLRRESYLRGKVCDTCGGTSRLDVHHKDPGSKSRPTSEIWEWSEERLQQELAKCVVRCHSCHIGNHNRDRKRPPDHGTRTSYQYGCRCQLCREADNSYQRDRRRNLSSL